MNRTLAAAFVALAVTAPAAPAADMITRVVEADFADIAFAVESAIVGRGLVIDSVSHVGAMLERTRADVGGTKTLFTAAEIYQFCSATVSRAVMEADPANLRFCPYGIYVYERPEMPGQVTVAFNAYPEGAMQAVQDLLSGIVADALGD
ncbi:MAG: DUF302 domain-containing protein [Gemmobacter sp.]